MAIIMPQDLSGWIFEAFGKGFAELRWVDPVLLRDTVERGDPRGGGLAQLGKERLVWLRHRCAAQDRESDWWAIAKC